MKLKYKNPRELNLDQLDLNNCKDVKEQIYDFFGTHDELILNLEELKQMDLAGWNTVVHAASWAKENHKGLKVLGKDNEVLKEFVQVAKMSFIFD